jgi:hypothetical protein
MNGCRYHLSCTLLIMSQVLLELSTTKRSSGVYRMIHTLKPHIFICHCVGAFLISLRSRNSAGLEQGLLKRAV